MNAVKIALLGTAALAAVSVSAQANDLADLKAQIEALNGRISQLESSPSVPAGYQLLSVSSTDAIIIPGLDSSKDKNYGKKATNIGVMPTADVPASTNIQWSGFVRVGVLSENLTVRTDDVLIATGAGIGNGLIQPTIKSKRLDIVSRAGLKVVGTTDTAVGEVGVRVALLATVEGFDNRAHDSSVATDGYWGWWKITPELTLGGGVDGSLANSSNAFDNRCTCAYIATGGAFGHGDPTQIRLSYASGPISFAVAVEDEANRTAAVGNTIFGGGGVASASKKSALGVAGEMKYSGDTIGFDLNAGYFDSVGATPASSDSAWTVNAGANMALGDIAKLGVAIGVGEDKHLAGNFDRYAKASVFLGFTLSDALTAELGGAYTDYKGNSSDYTIGGGLYYTPVSQLTLGLEASYRKAKNVAIDETATNVHLSSGKGTVVDAIAVWRF
jgi:opacity protein-like surface antigen